MADSRTRWHWPEYAIEAFALGTFMLSACVFGTLIGYPGSPVHRALATPLLQQVVMGALMGLTAIALIYSPWGKRSGAQMNPAVSLTFLGLGKIAPRDAAMYVVAQFAGATGGVLLAGRLIGMALSDPPVRYVVTQPGPTGPMVAWFAELSITFIQMTIVLRSAASPRWSRYTGLFAGCMVALYITFESPLSGMSMNPARTFGSAFAAMSWQAIWIYFTAPICGMVSAAMLYAWQRGTATAPCGKYSHGTPCIFCEYVAATAGSTGRLNATDLSRHAHRVTQH